MLHPLESEPADDCVSEAETFSCSLYRWIKSGSAGFGVALFCACDCEDADGVGELGGGGGWKVTGGCRAKGYVS